MAQVVDEHHTEDTRSHESVLRSERHAPATTFEVPAVCTATCTMGIPENQFLGWCPFSGEPRTAASPLKCGPHVAPSSAEKKGKTPKETTQGGTAGARGTTEESTETQEPVSIFCMFTFVWGCHTDSPANSFAGLRQRWNPRPEARLSPRGASGKRPPLGSWSAA